MHICCIVKPPSFSDRNAIVSALREREIAIIAIATFMYDKNGIDILYDHMDNGARELILSKYGGRIGSALLLEFTSIDSCMEIIGRASDPRACAPGTIRAEYGHKAEPEVAGPWQWWENALHRPVDERERIRDLKLVFPKYAPGAGG